MMGKRQKHADVQEKILDVDASMQGNLIFRDAVNLRINGRFEGNLDTKGSLTISEYAEVQADIKGENVIIEGHVTGNIVADKMLKIVSPGCVVGNVVTPVLVVTEGSILHGNVEMPQREFKLDKLPGTGALTAEELARYLEVEMSVIFEWANTGKIPVTKEGNTWRFDRSKIDAWLSSEKT